MNKNSTLIIPDKSDIERDSVAESWQNLGGEVLRIGKFWQPPELDPCKVHVYGNDTFCLVLQQKIGFKLISPSDTFLDNIDKKWLKRKLDFFTLADADKVTYPVFIKSAVPKIFKASVYHSLDDLKIECTGL